MGALGNVELFRFILLGIMVFLGMGIYLMLNWAFRQSRELATWRYNLERGSMVWVKGKEGWQMVWTNLKNGYIIIRDPGKAYYTKVHTNDIWPMDTPQEWEITHDDD